MENLELVMNGRNDPGIIKSVFTFPSEMVEELNKRFKKKLVKSEKALLGYIIRSDRRHLKYVLQFKVINALKDWGGVLDIDKLLKYRRDSLKATRWPTQRLKIDRFVIGPEVCRSSIRGVNEGLHALEFNQILSFIQFYKEQTK